MDNDSETKAFNVDEITSENVRITLKEVSEALEERGYNPINQIVGYIISDDLGYISNYREARNRISKIDRVTLIETILKEYLK